jgi:hypothetical protein
VFALLLARPGRSDRASTQFGMVSADLPRHATRPNEPCVEVWFIDP